MSARHTPGPWMVHPAVQTRGEFMIDAMRRGGSGGLIAKTFALDYTLGGDSRANARLIAAAPDHAAIGWAMCVGPARWEPFGDMRGEFCMNGIRYLTKLDEFGVPEMTDGMRAAIAKARGEA